MITLPKELEALIDQHLTTGRFRSADHVLAEALLGLLALQASPSNQALDAASDVVHWMQTRWAAEDAAQGISLREFKDQLATEAHGMTIGEAQAIRICLMCKQPPQPRTDLGRKEYEISGLCEACFEAIATEQE